MLHAEYRDRFLAMVEEVEKHPDIIVKEIENNFQLLSDDDIQWIKNNIKEKYTYDVPDQYIPFLLPDRLTLIWHFRFDQGAWIGAGGEFSLLSLSTALINPLETSLYRDGDIEVIEEHATLYRQSFRFFDQHVSGSGNVAGFKFDPNAAVFPVYWVPLCEDPIPLELDYHGYMEHILKTRGMIGWQYLFSSVRLDDIIWRPMEETIEEGLDAVQRLFPNDDFSEYLDRFVYLESGDSILISRCADFIVAIWK